MALGHRSLHCAKDVEAAAAGLLQRLSVTGVQWEEMQEDIRYGDFIKRRFERQVSTGTYSLHCLNGQAVAFDVQLERGDAMVVSSHLEIHGAKT